MRINIVVSGSFDDLRSPHIRFLQEAARLGDLHVLLWSDKVVQAITARAPRFPQAERSYLLEAVRYVQQVTLVDQLTDANTLPLAQIPRPDGWAVLAGEDDEEKSTFCEQNDLACHVITQGDLAGFPLPAPVSADAPSARKKVVVTGCFDWLHSGHVRFFEEVSALGDLYVVVGSDANVSLLKGSGHPLFHQDERRYMIHSIRYVTQALISTGSGWMDAEPEIERIRPDIYAVNQDGDRPEKRAFCEAHSLEYVVLRRLPKEGLPRRESTHLRGF